MNESVVIDGLMMGKDFKFKSSDIKKYVKKPIPIEAIQINEEFIVETLEGTMKGKSGDYLIKGIQGEYYPCDKQIFIDSYDVINE